MAGQIKPGRSPKPPRRRARAAVTISGACLCGGIAIETDAPLFWAWHDHSEASRRAHGAAYATYVGRWRSKVRVVGGEGVLARFDDLKRRQVRSFRALCKTSMMFTRGGSPKWLDIPRALFGARTGREAKHHVAIEQLQDWAYLGAPLGPLKGYPGVSIEKVPKAKPARGGLFET